MRMFLKALNIAIGVVNLAAAFLGGFSPINLAVGVLCLFVAFVVMD